MIVVIFAIFGLVVLVSGKLQVTARRQLSAGRANGVAGALLVLAVLLQVTAGASDEALQAGLAADALRRGRASALFTDPMSVRLAFIGLAVCAGTALTIGAYFLADEVGTSPRVARPSARTNASRSKRLLSFFVDQALVFAPVVVVMSVTKLMRRESSEDIAEVLPIIGATTLAIYGLQCWLMATTGQSLAKGWFGIRVARPDGTPPGFLRGVVVRSWLPAAVAFLLPVRALAALLALFDAARIWGRESRCVHDLLADTVVLDVITTKHLHRAEEGTHAQR